MSATETSTASDGRIMPAKPAEEDMHKYARQTRTATVWIAWIVGIVFTLSVIGGIIAAVQLNKASNQIDSVYNCQSLGGSDPSC
jgi:hypothetical protein